MKYALTYSFSLEDDLQVENQRERERERERETLTPRMGEYGIAEYLYNFIFTLIRGGSGSFC